MNDDLREAQRLFDATRTDAEKYAAELARINELYEKGAISQDTHARAIEMIGEKYLEAGNAAKFMADINDDLKSAILDLATNGEASFDKIAQAIKRAAFEALLFGEGPLANLFGGGGGGGGGLLGSLLGFALDLPKKADGGLIMGPGTGRSDSILLRASNGEFMVNAQSTARYLPLLKAINADTAGSLAKFADGGVIGSPGLIRAMPSALRTGEGRAVEDRRAVFEMNVSGTGNAEIRAGVHAAIEQAFGEFVRLHLPGQVRMIIKDNWGA